jgi:Transposase DDE domain
LWHAPGVTEHNERESDAPLREKDIVCLGHLKRVLPLLDKLHGVGCGRDTAGNRELFFDDYCKLVLLYVWNPLIDSVRTLRQACALGNVAKALGVKRFSLGSFSEAPAVFDPEALKPVIAELTAELSPLAKDPRLKDLKYAVTLVDSTVLTALTRLARFAAGVDADGLPASRCSTSPDGRGVHGWRLHTQLDLETFAPHRLDRTGARNAGAHSEGEVLRRNLEAGRCYVGDGGYVDRTLLNDVADAGSCYVIHMRDNCVFEAAEERTLSDEALAAGVVRDAVVDLGTAGTRRSKPMLHPVRLVAVEVTPHPRRTRRGIKQTDLILLATNLLDLPAELVALLYLYRYTIELFFRFFKQLLGMPLGMRHLLSQRPAGIDIQVHCTVIVCLLVCLITGKRPSKSNVNMVGWYLIGLASEKELIDHLNRPDNTGVKLRAKDALWKKLGVN